MRLILFLFGVMLLPLGLVAQRDDVAIPYAQQIVPAELSRLVHVLASDSLEGRETGMPGQKRAADFIEREFRAAGLVPLTGAAGYQLPYRLFRRHALGLEVSVKGRALRNLEDVFSMNSIDGVSLRADELVLITSEEKISLSSARGKVLVMYGGPEGLSQDAYRSLSQAVRNSGANALVIVDGQFKKNLAQLRHKLVGRQLALQNKWDARNHELPVVMMSTSAAKGLLKAAGTSARKLDRAMSKGRNIDPKTFTCPVELRFDQRQDTVATENVGAMVVGAKHPDEVVILTAHYDHLGVLEGQIHPGADDDGSGTATLMAMAKVLGQMAKDGLRPDRSIALLAVSGEEKGLLGSEFYSLNPIIPLKNTVCNLNIDMIGRWDAAHEQKADSMYTYVIGADRISKALHRANERVAESTGLRMDYTFDRADDPNRFYYRSDHYNFAKQNVPVIFYFTGVHKDYHRPTDTPDKLMYGKMAGIVRHIFRTAWHLADMPERIRPDK
jgi:hypothetical protein